jgi:hypothetical protein
MGVRAALSLALLLSAAAGIVAGPSVASAQTGAGLGSGTYTDQVYGFTVEWDPDLWTAEEIFDESGAPYGIYLYTDDVTASIAAAGYANPEECLEDRAARLESFEGVSSFRESRRADPLEFDREVTGAVYQYRWADAETGETDTWATYYGCEPLLVDGEAQPDVLLTHEFGTLLDSYDDLSADWVSIVNGVRFAGQTSSDDENERPTDAGQGGLSGNRYVDPTYAYSVTWDENLEAEELAFEEGPPYGVSLSGEAFIGSVYSNRYNTQRACVRGVAEPFSEIDGFTGFEEADDLPMPETAPGARAQVYRFTFVDSQTGNEREIVQYIECREIHVSSEPVEGVYLILQFGIAADVYDSMLPVLEEILGSVEFDVPLNTDDDTTDELGPDGPSDEPGVTGNRYLDPTDGWAVTWDATALSGENWMPDGDSEIKGLRLESDATNYLWMFGGDYSSIRRCMANQVSDFEGSAFTNFDEITNLDMPETADDARVALYQGIFTGSDSVESDIYLYVECRPMIVDGEEVDGRFLIVNALSSLDTYEDELPAWSEVLTSVEFDAAGGTGDNDGPSPRDEDVAGGIDGDTYASAIGYRLSWDDSIYVGELLDGTNPDLGLTLSSDGAFIQVQVVGDPDAAACVDSEAGTVEELSGMSRLTRSREESPDAGRNSESALFESTLTFDDGSETDVLVYIECRPLGNAEETPIFIVIRMVGLIDAFADELPRWQAILDSIEFIEPGD